MILSNNSDPIEAFRESVIQLSEDCTERKDTCYAYDRNHEGEFWEGCEDLLLQMLKTDEFAQYVQELNSTVC